MTVNSDSPISSFTADKSSSFSSSALLFQAGLASETFEIVRPSGVLIADYFFLGSLLVLLCSRNRQLLKSRGSGVLFAGGIILCGALLSFVISAPPAAAWGPYIKLLVLFGLIGPLAVVHARNVRANMFSLLNGIAFNCLIAILEAWVSPGIVPALSVGAQFDVYATELGGRVAGLAGHSNFLGLVAALAMLIGIGLFFSEKRTLVRWALLVEVFVCLLGALLSGSRTFVVSLVPGIIAFGMLRSFNRKAVLRVCIGLVGAFVLWASVGYAVPDFAAEYIGRLGATSADDTENYGRLLTAGMALVEISQKPIMGWGVERFGEAGMVYLPADHEFMPAHVSFLHYWYAEGILGALGFAMLFILPVRRMVKALKNNQSVDLANALRIGLSVYLLLFIACNLHPILMNRFLYVPLFLFAGLAANPASAPVPERSDWPAVPLAAEHA